MPGMADTSSTPAPADNPELADPSIDTDSPYYDPRVDGSYSPNGGSK